MRHADEALKLSDRLAGKMKGTGNRKGKKKGKASAGCITCELFDMSTTLVTKLANSFSDSTPGPLKPAYGSLGQDVGSFFQVQTLDDGPLRKQILDHLARRRPKDEA